MKLADRITSVKPSVTLAITSTAKKMKAAGEDVVSFGAGEPDFDTPQTIKQAAIKAIEQGFTKYTPAAGLSELKETVCSKLKEDNNLDYQPSQIVISCGAKHSLYNIFQVLCQAGDEVIIPVPYWVSYPEMVKMAQAQPVFVKTSLETGFKITPDDFKQALTPNTKAVIINSPSNPTGTVYTREELTKIAQIAVKHKVHIISDEIYETLLYDGLNHVSAASLSKDIYDWTITVNGLSKSHSMTGWRIGYLAASLEIAQAVTSLQSHSTSNPASISQKAAIAAFDCDKRELKKMADEFCSRRDYMVREINNIKNLSCFKPSGAFYVFCCISQTGLSSVDFAGRLLNEYKTAVIPGSGFGQDDYIRLSFATSMANITEGLSRLSEFVSKL